MIAVPGKPSENHAVSRIGWPRAAVGAALLLAAALLLPLESLAIGISIAALLVLMLLGGVGAGAGGAPIGKGVLRVTFWGMIAMAVTYAIGRMLGTSVG